MLARDSSAGLAGVAEVPSGFASENIPSAGFFWVPRVSAGSREQFARNSKTSRKHVIASVGSVSGEI
eukprot:15453917-Alexandrium_andersonii.AAC.1